ncbi:MAG TPA: hypothetical protein VGQ83_26685 [Polyangia bacterium]
MGGYVGGHLAVLLQPCGGRSVGAVQGSHEGDVIPGVLHVPQGGDHRLEAAPGLVQG